MDSSTDSDTYMEDDENQSLLSGPIMPLLAVASVAGMQPEADMVAVAAAAVACDFMERGLVGAGDQRGDVRPSKEDTRGLVGEGINARGDPRAAVRGVVCLSTCYTYILVALYITLVIFLCMCSD
ncbi:uncharacterized protein LOC143040600 isoform X2 [Oratosquilla oratoria]|uniref:uncharacterized protein LOC143040600 isoform X2 n=1 Tax=Oratosquilla oratoria TaxID=337810 RepID=UPI003F7686AF